MVLEPKCSNTLGHKLFIKSVECSASSALEPLATEFQSISQSTDQSLESTETNIVFKRNHGIIEFSCAVNTKALNNKVEL